MKLIKYLDSRPVGKRGSKRRYGLYECPMCHKHFECRLDHIKSGNTTKCRNCANKANAKASSMKVAEEFIEKATAVHGDLYTYTLFTHSGSKVKGIIQCNTCSNTFEQRADMHIAGQGCPYCAKHGFDKSKPAIVYYLKVTHNNIIAYKIGITNRTVKERFSNDDLEKITILETWKYLIGAEAYEHEQQILKQYKDYKYTGEPLISSGNTELFTIDILGLDVT